MFSFADAATSGVILPFSLSQYRLNPYKPIKLKIAYSSTAANGDVALRVRYKGFATSDLTTASTVTGATDTVPAGSVANGVRSFTTSLAVVPNSEFAGFVGGKWVINKDHLNIILERVGTDSVDTNTGSFRLISVALVQ
jgi:hypothetical protein